AYCGLYLGVVGSVIAWLRPRLGAGWAVAIAPVLWVAGEWVRGHLMGGFPWGLLGYSQHAALPVIQIAELGGVYAVSFLLVAVNAALAAAAALGWRRARYGLIAVGMLALFSVAFGVRALRVEDAANERADALTVAVIQPSIEQMFKWDPVRHAETIAIHERLTREAARARPALVVWPETAA